MRWILFVFISFYLKIATAQDPMHYIIGKDELEGIHLYSIIQDEDNSVWITSDKGIHHYNGKDFTFQLPENTQSTAFFGLTKDSSGSIFCFNLNGQIFKIKDKKAELHYTIPSRYLKDGLSIAFDNKNNLIAKINDNLLIISSEKKILNSKKRTGFFLRKFNDSIFYGKENKSATGIKLVCRYNDKESSTLEYDYSKDKNSFIYTSFICKIKNNFYGYSNTNTYIFKIRNNEIAEYKYPFLNDDQFKVFDTKDDIWFCDYHNGVYKVSKTQVEDINVNSEKWFDNMYISGGMNDSENNTWLLTFGKGVIIIPDTPVKTNTHSIDGEVFKAISKTEDTIYVSTAKSNIYQWKNNKLYKFRTIKNNVLEYFKILPERNLIITSNYIYNYKTGINEAGGFTKNAIFVGDTMYLASIGGLRKISLDLKYQKYLTDKRSFDIVYDHKQELIWISTTAGLYTFRIKDGVDEPYFFNKKQLYTRKLVNVNGAIWVNTNKGIYIIKNKKIVDSLSTQNGLLSNSISDIKYEKPYVFIASKKGMQLYNTKTKKYRNITKSDGIVKSIQRFEVLGDTIFALNNEGLITFSFKDFETRIPKYQTKITEAIVNGSANVYNNAILNPNENNIEFSFLTTSYKYHKDLRYEYQLLGFENAPIKAKEGQYFVNYSNLPAGTYTFKVDSFIKNSKNKSASLTFTIEEYWYNTLIFKTIITSLVLLLIYAVYKTRINSVERKRYKEAMERQLIESTLTSLKAQMNPHFIFNSLNSIQDLVLINDIKGSNKYLGKFSDLIRKILLSSKENYISLEQEVEILDLYLDLEKLRFGDDFTIVFKNNISKKEQKNIQIPAMFIQPYVENAIKHGLFHKKGKKKLIIDFSKENNYLKCIVEDNGIGVKKSSEIKQKRLHTGFSTGAINNRIKLINKTSKDKIILKTENLYSDNKPDGTRITLLFPIK